jgi:hydrogenase maturation protein HypF
MGRDDFKNAESGLIKRRLKATIMGAVQGVGFRPFVFRVANELGLNGWVKNSPEGVFIEAEGTIDNLDQFIIRLKSDKPTLSSIQSFESSFLDPVGYRSFDVLSSQKEGQKTTLVMPDIGTCSDCLNEMSNPADRRYRYPFINCTNCGPRFSIIEALPYDRPNTSMKDFPMCDNCRAEYENPADRRFHAQPIACPGCGPHLELWDKDGNALAKYDKALTKTVQAIKNGQIVAVKGLGGFHLVVDALNEEAVKRLRQHKNREEKPFALMYPSLESAKSDCVISSAEERLLLSPESPIVLLRKKPAGHSTDSLKNVAPNNPYLGIMLPYTPLHHLLMAELSQPIVATSGNLTDEPICIDEREALSRLNGIADLFLVHNRPIVRHVDDSIARLIMGQEMVLRRARGYAPLPVYVKQSLPRVLAVGAHLKNSVAIAVDNKVFISQHIGDLETAQAYEAFSQVIKSLGKLYDFNPQSIACDEHPDYMSSKYAQETDLPVIKVQHHYAHVLAGMADNELKPPVLGVAWDGTGYGSDGTIWGGEFLSIEDGDFERFAHFRTFSLPGGERAIKEPRRSALGILYEMYEQDAFKIGRLATSKAFFDTELPLFEKMLAANINCPRTSSAGRLFDAVASIIDIRQTMNYEGQAAMELEYSILDNEIGEHYKYEISLDTKPIIIDWEPMIRQIIADVRNSVSVGIMAAKFHNTLAEIILHIARLANCKQVVLSGGSFQNKYLIERAIARLRAEGFNPYWHQRIPPNDGGIALGQIMAAARRQKVN